jgi:hypothetical protein
LRIAPLVVDESDIIMIRQKALPKTGVEVVPDDSEL